MQKSFTLIELLVVIAIIGLLSATVLVSMKGIRSKARITRTLEFGQSMNNALGAYAMGVWSFDDQTNPTKDSSGYGNNGAVNGASFSSDTPHAEINRGADKYSLEFNAGDNVNAGNGNALNITGNAITIEAWVKPTVAGVHKHVVSKSLDGGQRQYNLYVSNAEKVDFIITTSVGGMFDLATTETIPLNNWSHIVATYNGSSMTIYINGKFSISVPRTGNIVSKSADVLIGSFMAGQSSFMGFIDEVRVYETALTLGQIRQHYAEGLEKYKDLAVE